MPPEQKEMTLYDAAMLALLTPDKDMHDAMLWDHILAIVEGDRSKAVEILLTIEREKSRAVRISQGIL